MARKFIATHQIMYHSSYLLYPRIPPLHPLLLHHHRRKRWKDTESPSTRRSEKASEDSSARGNSWHESTEIENPNKDDDEELQSDELQGVPDWPQEFKHGVRNGDIQELNSKWDGILLSMTKIPPDDILEGLYKLRVRESEKLKTVLELYDPEIHQKKAEPDYHRLKTMIKRSIEQNLRMKKFGARNGNYERNAMVKNPGTKQGGQRILKKLLAMGIK